MAQHSEPVSGGMSDSMERSGAATAHRPGMLTFAAVIMFMVAGLEAIAALLAFAGTGWWVTDAGPPRSSTAHAASPPSRPESGMVMETS
jgi:hypothetical protein